MAENKKSFVAYCDWIHTVEKLTHEQAGELFKHILRYVNDQNPTTDNLIVDIAFEPIKQQLKRDLKKYEQYIEKQKVNGAKGGRPLKTQPNEEKPKKPKPFSENPTKPKKADNVNVNDNVNDNDINNKSANNSLTLKDRKEKFANRIKIAADELGEKDKELLTEFYRYWVEMNDNGKKMKFEKQKTFSTKRRLQTWIKNQSKFNPQKSNELPENMF